MYKIHNESELVIMTNITLRKQRKVLINGHFNFFFKFRKQRLTLSLQDWLEITK